MSRLKRFQLEPEPINHERWLVSYADYMTLLFALFVVLYSLAITKEEEFRVLTDTLQQVFEKTGAESGFEHEAVSGDGILDANTEDLESTLLGNAITDLERGPELVDGHSEIINLKEKRQGNPLESLKFDLQTALNDVIESGYAKLTEDDEWLNIELSSGLLFMAGSATVTNSARVLLKQIDGIIAPVNNYVRVRGYTDNQAISTELFQSNWHLSVTRATNIVIEMEKMGIPSGRLAIEGFGEHAPFADNTTPEGRAENRKVVIALSKFAYQPPHALTKPVTTEINRVERTPAVEQSDANEIRIIELPGGGIRVTTRQEDN